MQEETESDAVVFGTLRTTESYWLYTAAKNQMLFNKSRESTCYGVPFRRSRVAAIRDRESTAWKKKNDEHLNFMKYSLVGDFADSYVERMILRYSALNYPKEAAKERRGFPTAWRPTAAVCRCLPSSSPVNTVVLQVSSSQLSPRPQSSVFLSLPLLSPAGALSLTA